VAPDPGRWFAEQVHPHDGQLKAYLRGSFPSVRDVEDVVQESYLRIWKAKAAQPIQSAKAFLFKVARHIAVDLIRRRQRSPEDSVSDFDSLNVIGEGSSVESAARLQEKIALLTDALAALPDRRREIIVLRKLKRLSQREVAETLGISERTVENLLFRGIKQCQAYLQARGLRSFSDEP
jgi:RNA polymerase sigma factor (sigma-70 family)